MRKLRNIVHITQNTQAIRKLAQNRTKNFAKRAINTCTVMSTIFFVQLHTRTVRKHVSEEEDERKSVRDRVERAQGRDVEQARQEGTVSAMHVRCVLLLLSPGF